MFSKSFLIFYLNSLICLVKGTTLHWDTPNPAFDPQIYEDALDREQCQTQLDYLSSDLQLRLKFIDAGLRLPKGITDGNLNDLGNYHQCLGTRMELEETYIEGKYCSIAIPLPSESTETNEEILIEKLLNPNLINLGNNTTDKEIEVHTIQRGLNIISGIRTKKLRTSAIFSSSLSVNLAVCIPKPCTTREGIEGLYSILDSSNLTFTDNFCRFINDKSWVPADTVTVVLYSLIALITVISTVYNLCYVYILKKDAKEISKVYTSFSLYTNSRRLTTFTKSSSSIECLDGIRSLSMMWVVLGHAIIVMPLQRLNMSYILEFVQSWEGLPIMAAPISVDTFFMLSGLLVVYTSAGKFTGTKLMKNLHLFYLNRIVRMFPLLAAAILFQISIAHRVADGPNWSYVEASTNVCRVYWWTTLLYIQNYVQPVCLSQTWYLAVDMQLYILSPIVLVWVLSGKKFYAWTALSLALIMSLAATTIYVFIKDFPAVLFNFRRLNELGGYMRDYYFNTLTRNSAFLVGMAWGYILHLWRGRRVVISRLLASLLWIFSLSIMGGFGILIIKPMAQIDYSNQLLDNFTNAFQRPSWALGLGWVIFACHHGYGGPINWFLSLQSWKLMSRISFAIYLFHFPIQLIIYGTFVETFYFTEAYAFYHFLAQMVITFAVAFIMTLVVDAPFSTLFKLLLSPGHKNRPVKPAAVLPVSDEFIESKGNGLDLEGERKCE